MINRQKGNFLNDDKKGQKLTVAYVSRFLEVFYAISWKIILRQVNDVKTPIVHRFLSRE